MRERVSPKTLLGNLQSQVEQIPHLANMTRDLLERLSQPHRHDPPPPYRRDGDHWALRLLGAGLLAGGVLSAITHTQTGAAPNTLSAWPGLADAGGRGLSGRSPIAIGASRWHDLNPPLERPAADDERLAGRD